MSIILNDKKLEIPGMKTLSWLDGDPKIKYVTDKGVRKRRTRLIVMHTHEGVKGSLLEGVGPNTTIDERLALYQVTTDRYVSWDGTIDMNGDLTWQNDPCKNFTWQAGQDTINNVGLGIELVQKITTENGSARGDLWKGQIEKAVLLIDFLTAKLGIQRQIPWDKARNRPVLTQIPRLQKSDGGADMVGIIGHVMITTTRGPGDPGPYIFEALRDAGYELFDMAAGEDLTAWKQRQAGFGIIPRECDGIPLDKMINLLKSKGHKHGMFIPRPCDLLIQEE